MQDDLVLLEIGKMYIHLKNYKEAARVLRLALEANSQNAQVHEYLAVAYSLQGEYKQAEKAYRQYLILEPDDPDGWEHMGDVYRLMGQWDQAREAYRRSKELRGQTAERLPGGEEPPAPRSFSDEALSDGLETVSPDVPPVAAPVTDSAQPRPVSAGQRMRALVQSQPLAETRPSWTAVSRQAQSVALATEVDTMVAVAARPRESQPAAEAPAARPLPVGQPDAPQKPPLRILSTDEIESQLERMRLVLSKPHQPSAAHRAWNQLGYWYRAAGRYQDALQAFKRAAESMPISGYFYNMGTMYVFLGREQDALNAFNQALELNEQNGLAYCAAAGSYLRLGDRERARINLQMARRHYWHHLKAYDRACCEAMSGNVREAIIHLRKAFVLGEATLQQIQDDPDLQFIRDSREFQVFLEEARQLMIQEEARK